MQRQRLGEDVADRHARVERGIRVLKHKLRVAAEGARRGCVEREHVVPAEAPVAGRRLDQPQHEAPDGRLAGAGFATSASVFRPDREIDAVHGLARRQRPPERRAFGDEVLHQPPGFNQYGHAAPATPLHTEHSLRQRLLSNSGPGGIRRAQYVRCHRYRGAARFSPPKPRPGLSGRSRGAWGAAGITIAFLPAGAPWSNARCARRATRAATSPAASKAALTRPVLRAAREYSATSGRRQGPRPAAAQRGIAASTNGQRAGETAADRRRRHVRHDAVDGGKLVGALVEPRDRGEQPHRVGMSGASNSASAGARSTISPRIHHGDVVADFRHHAEVVRNRG